jgi:tetratricopeptide (TPR) repeat protein
VKRAGFSNSFLRWWRGQVKREIAAIVTGVAVALLGLVLTIIALPEGMVAASSDDSFQLGLNAYQRGQLNEALNYFREAARLHPRDARAANALANTWFALKQPSLAVQEYRRAIQLDPVLAAAHKNLGILEYQQGNFPAAQRALEGATRLAPADPVAWRFLGLTYAASKRPARAVGALRRSLELAPHDSTTRLSLAAAEADAGERDAARTDYRVLVRDASLDAHGQGAVGTALLALDDPEDAERQLSFALGHQPGDEDLELALARAQWAAHRPEQAVMTLRNALPAAKDKAALFDSLGWIEQQSNDPTQAAEAYRNAILADPKRPEPYLQLSWLYAAHRHFEEAEQTLREGLRFVEASYPLNLQLGTVLVLAGRETEAVPILEEAVASQPHNPLGYSTLIIADTMVDTSYARALRTAETALRECANDYLLHYLYAGLLWREHRPELGQPCAEKIFRRIRLEFRESIRLNPDFPHSHYDLARLEYDTQHFAQAERAAAAALKADKDFSSARYLLGRIYLKEGRRQEGLDEIARVDREHREEMQRIQAVGQTLLAAQAARMGGPMLVSHPNVTAAETSK